MSNDVLFVACVFLCVIGYAGDLIMEHRHVRTPVVKRLRSLPRDFGYLVPGPPSLEQMLARAIREPGYLAQELVQREDPATQYAVKGVHESPVFLYQPSRLEQVTYLLHEIAKEGRRFIRRAKRYLRGGVRLRVSI